MHKNTNSASLYITRKEINAYNCYHVTPSAGQMDCMWYCLFVRIFVRSALIPSCKTLHLFICDTWMHFSHWVVCIGSQKQTDQRATWAQLTHLSALTGGFCKVIRPTEPATRVNWAMKPAWIVYYDLLDNLTVLSTLNFASCHLLQLTLFFFFLNPRGSSHFRLRDSPPTGTLEARFLLYIWHDSRVFACLCFVGIQFLPLTTPLALEWYTTCTLQIKLL